MDILITGSDGFVGRHFSWYLQKYNVTGIDIKSGVDCRDFFKREDKQYDLVIHLAAIVGGRETIEGRPLAVADNLSIDSEFFQWCLKTKPKKVVYFSSSAAYPVSYQTENMRSMRLREAHIDLTDMRTPDLTYGWSKLSGEFLAQFVPNVHIFRPFSGYAWDQDLTYPFPSIVTRAVKRANPFEVWGNGQQTRDFIHIDDVVEAVMTAVANDIQGATNLGWGRSTSFLELAKMCMDAVGYEAEIKTLPNKPFGCVHRVSDNNKMLSFYTPKITLEEGIAEAVNKLG